MRKYIPVLLFSGCVLFVSATNGIISALCIWWAWRPVPRQQLLKSDAVLHVWTEVPDFITEKSDLFHVSYDGSLDEQFGWTWIEIEMEIPWQNSLMKTDTLVIAEAGWPIKSLKYVKRFAGGLRQNPPDTPQTPQDMLWNMRPKWKGLFLNSLLYLAGLAAVTFLPKVIRRHRRINRNRCPACGYPTGQSDRCSECGRPLPARLVSPSASS